MIDFHFWETEFQTKITQSLTNIDPSHDFSHFQRVAKTAKEIAVQENACLEVVIPASWLHDLINVPKDSPNRKRASQLSADAAVAFLRDVKYPEEFHIAIHHAIESHSFSANIPVRTLEAQVVQDADRLDAIGSIGIARCFIIAGMLKRPIYSPIDPFAKDRRLNDNEFTLDHFFIKLFKIGDLLHTSTAQKEGAKRIETMRLFLKRMENEI